MSDLLRSPKYPTGQHPDAEQLSAFVEHVLPEHDRLGTLAHLAECADCREIVALSLPPLEDAAAEEPVPAVLPRYIAWFRGLGSGWRLVWIAAPALAALVVLTIYLRKLPVRQRWAATSGQVAASHPPAPPTAVPSPAKPERFPERSPERPPERSKVALEPRAAPGRPTQHAARPREGEGRVDDLPISGRKVAAYKPPPPVVPEGKIDHFKAAPGTAGRTTDGPVLRQGSMAGMAAGGGARGPSAQKSAVVGEPASSRPTPPVVPDQNSVPVAGAARAPYPAQESATINASAQSSAVDSVTASEVPDDAATLASPGSANMAGQAPLPSRRPVLSVAANLRQRLALDTRNQLFLSEDDGRHWKAVSMPWRARATHVASLGFGFGIGAGAGIGTGTGTGAIGAASHRAPQLALAVPERYTPGASASTEPEYDVGSSVSSLRGVVTDASGAAVPGATIIATDSHTKLTRTVQTDSAGHYLVEELPPGVYRLEAQAAGFLKQSQVAAVGSPQQAVLNLVLSVGQVSQTVTVETASAQLQTSSRSMPLASAKVPEVTPAPPVFVVTTESGDRWMSRDGLTWKHE